MATTEVLSPEGLNAGRTALLTAGLCGFLGAAAMSATMTGSVAREGSAANLLSPQAHETTACDDRPAIGAVRLRFRRRISTMLVLVMSCVALTYLSLGLIAILLVLVAGTTYLSGARSWSPAAAFFATFSYLSAAEVIGGRLVLSPMGWVGEPVPVMLVAVVAMAPLVHRVGELDVWRRAGRRVGVLDLAALFIAGGAGVAWLHVFAGMGPAQIIAQLTQLGEDNNAHLLMLQATESSGTALGAGESSQAVTALFSGYYPGASLWQAAVGAFAPAMSTPRLYVVSTAVLFALMAGSISAMATLSARRSAAFAAVGVIIVGAIGIRLILAQYQFGFPGHMLAAAWLITTLTMVMVEPRTLPSRVLQVVAMLVLAWAAWWTWPLVTPLCLVPASVIVAGAILRIQMSMRVRVALLVTVGLLACLSAVLLRTKIVATLDQLNIEGPVSRAVPIWAAFLLVLGFPVAVRQSRRVLSAEATSLVLAVAATTMLLSSWQFARLGHVSYYSYKLEYLLLAIAWASLSILVGALIADGERLSSRAVRVGGSFLLAVACIPVVASASQTYEGRLREQGALGPSPGFTCAAVAAAAAPDDSVAIGIGFGNPTMDYLTTKSMINGSESDASFVFWRPILNADQPMTWPWTVNAHPVVLVRGPSAEAPQIASIVAAAGLAGSHITVRSCAA